MTIWPDNDQLEDGYAKAVGRLILDVGGTVRIVAVPDGAPQGWDLADPLPEGWTAETIAQALGGARRVRSGGAVQGPFMVVERQDGQRTSGVYRKTEKVDKETGIPSTEWVWFCSRCGCGRRHEKRVW